MRNYKIALHKLTLMVLSALLFVGCIKPQKKTAEEMEAEGADNNATFYAKEITGKALAGNVATSWKVPVTTQFNLQVCVQDKRTQDDIRLNKFVILGGEKEVHVRSDNNGCVNWTETLPFELLGQPTYVEIDRQLKSEGLQTGQRTLKIALNPWAALSGFANEAVIDLNKHDAPEGQLVKGDDAKRALRGVDRDGKAMMHRLSIDSLSVENIDLNQQGQSRSIRTQVIFKPFILIQETDSDRLKWNLTYGKVNVDVQWIANVQGRKTVISHAKTDSPITLNDNLLFSTAFPMQMRAPADGGTIEFAIKVTPVDGPTNLGPFEGVFNLGGGITSVMGPHTLDPSTNMSVADKKDFSVSQYTAGGKSQSADVANLQEFFVDHLKSSDVHLSQNSNSSKTIALSFSSHLLDSVNGAPRVYVSLKLKDTSGKTHALQTDGAGQFTWNESIRYNPYEADHSFRKSVTVTAADGFTQCIPVRLDPWVYDAHQPAQVAVDARDLGDGTATCGESSVGSTALATDDAPLAAPAGGSLRSASASAAEVKLNGYVVTEQGRYYSSDKHLLLHSTQKVTMDLDASILMPADRISGQRAATPLNDGVYYVRMAVRLPPLGPLVNEEIGTSQQLAYAEGGKLKSINFNFDVSDARAYGARSELYVEISPVDQAKLGKMNLDQAILKYKNPSDLLPKGKMWAPRLFVAPYVAGGGQQMTTFQALDDLLNGQAMDSSSSNVTNSNLSVAGGQVVTDDFFAQAKRYTHFEQLRAQAATIQNQRLQNVLNLEKTSQMVADLNAFAYDTSAAKTKPLLTRLGLDKVNVDAIFHEQHVTRDDVNALCMVWGHNLLPSAMGELHITPTHYSGDTVTSNCQSMMGRLVYMDWLNFKAGTKAQMPFAIETRMKLIDAASTVQVLGNNQQMTLMVGNAFNATYTKAFQGAWNVGAELGGGVGFNLGFIEAEAGAKTSAVRTDSSSVSVNNAQIVTAMSPLTVTKQTLELQVHTYRPCMVASSSDALNAWEFSYLKLSGLTDQQALQVMSKRIMLCNAPIQKQAGKYLHLKENYYIVSTPIIDGKAEDGAAQDSHVWGQVIRGDADFANFLKMAQRSDQRGDVSQVLAMAIPDFIQNHTTMAMGHPGYYIMPDFPKKPVQH